jgi:hypothetical protein
MVYQVVLKFGITVELSLILKFKEGRDFIVASFICKCGERLSDFESPNDIEFRVYSDREWDSILENDAIETWKIPFPKHSAWKCPKCERLYIFKEGNNEAIKVYRLED